MPKKTPHVENYCAMRAMVEQLLSDLKAGDRDGALGSADMLAKSLDECIADYGDKGKAIYARIRGKMSRLEWRLSFLDGSRDN
jgi:hypothetical protein